MSTSVDQFYGPLYGSLYFAAVKSTAFYGVACMQTFFYYVHYPDDPLPLKIFAGLAWALNTIHEALAIAGVYKYIVAGLLDISSFEVSPPELLIQYLPTALLAVSTQAFLVYRIYILSGRRFIVPLIWVVLAIVEFVCGNLYFVKALYSANGAVHVVSLSTLNGGSFVLAGTLSLSFAAGIDVLIAICMTFLLLREWKVTKFRRTAHVLQRLTIFAVNTGAWTAMYALLAVILLHLFPGGVLYTVFSVPLCSVYCNTVLANLNARIYFWGGPTLGTTVGNMTVDNTTFDLDLPASSSLRSRVSRRAKGNRHHEGARLDSSENQGPYRPLEMETFLDAGQSKPIENM